MKTLKRVTAALLSLLLIVMTFSPFVAVAANNNELVPYINYFNYNQGKNGSHTYVNPGGDGTFGLQGSRALNTYLYPTEYGFLRVEHIENELTASQRYCLIEEYDNDFNLLKQLTIRDELSEFCGFFHGENYNFFAYCQPNYECDDDKEVIRIVKYDDKWTKKGTGKIIGKPTQTCSITQPFISSNFSFTEYNNNLYVRTSRKMYNGHQANFDCIVDEETLNISCKQSSYVSHSFKQISCISNGNLFCVDLGDGAPFRGINTSLIDLTTGLKPYTDGGRDVAFVFNGENGYNYCGARLYDCSASTQKNFIIFTSIDQSVPYVENQSYLWEEENHIPEDVYFSVLRSDLKNAYYDGAEKITSFPKSNSENTYALNPCIVKFNDNRFIAMWNRWTVPDDAKKSERNKMCYFIFDGQGNKLTDIIEFNGLSSNCHPVVKDDKAYWYVTSEKGMTVCSIDVNGNYKEQSIVTFTGEFKIKDEDRAIVLGTYKDKNVEYTVHKLGMPKEMAAKYEKFYSENSSQPGTGDNDNPDQPDIPVYDVGWVKLPNGWHYFERDGSECEGWRKIDNKWYHFTYYCAMQTGWQKINNKWYYFGSDGAMRTGWQTIDGKKYYFKSSGEMVTWTNVIDGKTYYFNGSGVMQKGWVKFGSKYKFFNMSSGVMLKGWQTISNKKYYFDTNGYMLTGLQTITNKKYYFNSSGVAQKGWQSISGKWYYFNSNYESVLWRNRIGNKWYYFNGAGIMQKNGWIKGSKWFYADSSGVLKTGWAKISNKWYYFNSTGEMQTGWKTIGGSKYYFNSSGYMVTGWQKLSGKWYYFNSSGSMRTANLKQGSKTYRFDKNGVCLNP